LAFPLDVAIYPINGDGTDASANFIQSLHAEDFAALSRFLERETRRYGIRRTPAMKLTLQPEMTEALPEPPKGGGTLQTMWWRLKLRWWSYQHAGTLLPQLGKSACMYCFIRPQTV
jgi:hypothetical protein